MAIVSETVVIGGGPAGLMTALRAAQRGHSVALHEQLPEPGRKLLATGGGRCNITTTAPMERLLQAFGRQGRFAAPALAAFGPAAIRDFLRDCGVPTTVEADGAVFPASQRATDILNALRRAAVDAGVNLICHSRATHILSAADGRVGALRTITAEYPCRNIVIATGGRSYPSLGATGSGHQMAESLGLRDTPPVPALEPLVTAEAWPASLSGIVLPQARLRLIAKGAAKAGVVGPLLFTHRGISGPAALELSGDVAQHLQTHDRATLSLAARADRDPRQWLQFFNRWRHAHGRRMCHNLLAGELPRTLAEAYCQLAGVVEKPLDQASHKALQALADLCGAAPLTITATEGWQKAIITRGGISLREIDPNTMACKRIPGLYGVGEVVDIDGPCGGYNLTWALASGHLCGISIG